VRQPRKFPFFNRSRAERRAAPAGDAAPFRAGCELAMAVVPSARGTAAALLLRSLRRTLGPARLPPSINEALADRCMRVLLSIGSEEVASRVLNSARNGGEAAELMDMLADVRAAASSEEQHEQELAGEGREGQGGATAGAEAAAAVELCVSLAEWLLAQDTAAETAAPESEAADAEKDKEEEADAEDEEKEGLLPDGRRLVELTISAGSIGLGFKVRSLQLAPVVPLAC